VCAHCSRGPCPAGSFEASPCSAFADRVCRACKASCSLGQYLRRRCGPVSDAECADCPGIDSTGLLTTPAPANSTSISNSTSNSTVPCPPAGFVPLSPLPAPAGRDSRRPWRGSVVPLTGQAQDGGSSSDGDGNSCDRSGLCVPLHGFGAAVGGRSMPSYKADRLSAQGRGLIRADGTVILSQGVGLDVPVRMVGRASPMRRLPAS